MKKLDNAFTKRGEDFTLIERTGNYLFYQRRMRGLKTWEVFESQEAGGVELYPTMDDFNRTAFGFENKKKAKIFFNSLANGEISP